MNTWSKSMELVKLLANGEGNKCHLGAPYPLDPVLGRFSILVCIGGSESYCLS